MKSSPNSCATFWHDIRHIFSRQAAFALFALLVPVQAVFAQGAEIPPRDVYQDRGHTPGNKVALCVNGAAMMAPFEIALARELSSALLLTPQVTEIKTWRPTEPLDYRLPMTFEDIFIEFAERCDGFMGFTLSQGYPEWMTITRPYLTTRTVLATMSPTYRRLADIPTSSPIGTRILGGVDNQTIMYLQSLPEKSRWRRLAYYNNRILIDRLLDGTVAAAFVWEPALYKATGGKPEAAGIHLITAPFEPYETELGIALRSNERFLMKALGDAIESLRADGTIDRLLVAHGFAAAKPAGK